MKSASVKSAGVGSPPPANGAENRWICAVEVPEVASTITPAAVVSAATESVIVFAALSIATIVVPGVRLPAEDNIIPICRPAKLDTEPSVVEAEVSPVNDTLCEEGQFANKPCKRRRCQRRLRSAVLRVNEKRGNRRRE